MESPEFTVNCDVCHCEVNISQTEHVEAPDGLMWTLCFICKSGEVCPRKGHVTSMLDYPSHYDPDDAGAFERGLPGIAERDFNG